MVRSLVVAGLLVALVPVSAGAQEDSAPTAPEKKICRRDVATGSVMVRMTCRTKAEWDALGARGRSDAERQINQERLRTHIQNNR